MSEIDNLDRLLEGRLEEKKKKRKKRRKWIILFIILLLLLLSIGGCFMWKKAKPQSKYDIDRNALEGFLPGKTQQEIEAELSRIIEEGRVNVAMNPTPILKDGKLNVTIENVPANRYYLQVDVYLYPEQGNADKSELIYSSGVIKQGFYVEEGDAKTKVNPGQYDGLAVFHALYPDTLEEIGTTGMTLVITVSE